MFSGVWQESIRNSNCWWVKKGLYRDENWCWWKHPSGSNREVCRHHNIVDAGYIALYTYHRCDRNQDGMIDYHEFSMYLSKKGLPNSDSKTVNTVFREDYKHPFVQRWNSSVILKESL